MTTPILVTGGTGTLGRHLVPRLLAAHPAVRVLSRRQHEAGDGVEYVVGDLLRDEGIEQAVAGAETVVHCAGGAKGDADATGNLVRAARRAGVRHLVYISVTGAGQVPLGYFRAKAASERIISGSGVPWTTLRAAQFHDLVLTVLTALTKSPVVPVVGGMRFQSVDSAEVADRLAELALDRPAGLVPDLVGPAVFEMRELVRGYLRTVGRRRLLLPIRLPGQAGRAYRAGDNLARAGALVGKRTWADFLAERTA